MKKKDRNKQPSLQQKNDVVVAPVWQLVLGWTLLLWIFFVLMKFDQKFPSTIDPMLQSLEDFLAISPSKILGVIFTYVKSLILLAAVIVGASGLGARVCPNQVFEKVGALGQFVFSLVFGYLLFSSSVAALGFLGYLSKVDLYVFLLAFTGAGFFLSKEKLKEWGTQLRSLRLSSLIDSPSGCFLIALCGIAFMMAFVPELFYDSLVYHLGLPQMYINEGRILDTPFVYFSRAPMLIHMLYVFAVGIDGSILAKLLNWSLLMAGVGSTFVLCRLMGWQKREAWAGLFIMVMPVVQLNVWSTAVDSAMGVFIVLSAVLLMVWYQNPTESLSLICATGLMSGAAFASKYTGVVTVIVCGVASIVLMWRRLPFDRIVVGAAGFAIFSFLIVSPWLVRNAIWTGNPVYPILSSVLESRHMNYEKMGKEKNNTTRGRINSVGGYLTYPWTKTMQELSSFNFIGPMVLAGLPLLLFLPWNKKKDVLFLTFLTGAFFAFALQFAGDVRYLMSGFFLLAVLFAGGLTVVGELKPVVGLLVRGAIFILALYHTNWIFTCFQGLYRPAPVLLGNQSRQDYSATMHDGLNLCPWNVMDAELRALPEPCRIYILGNEQVFGFPKRFVYSAVQDYTPLVIWANESQDSAALYEKIKSEGITHILFNAPEAVRLRGYDLFPWRNSGLKNFYQFANEHLNTVQVKPIAHIQSGLFLFEVRDHVDQPQPFGSFEGFFGGIFTQKKI